MKIKCKLCGEEFDCEPKHTVFCGTEVTSEESYARAEVSSICPACSENSKPE